MKCVFPDVRSTMEFLGLVVSVALLAVTSAGAGGVCDAHADVTSWREMPYNNLHELDGSLIRVQVKLPDVRAHTHARAHARTHIRVDAHARTRSQTAHKRYIRRFIIITIIIIIIIIIIVIIIIILLLLPCAI